MICRGGFPYDPRPSTVCADDQLGLNYGHIITVVGDLGDRYKVVDPAWGWPTKRDKRTGTRPVPLDPSNDAL